MAERLMTRVRELRVSRGLSQEAFAECAGLKYKHYQAVEAGRKPKIQLPTLVKMADALEMELWELFKFDTAPSIQAKNPVNSRADQSATKAVRKTLRHPHDDRP